MFVHELQQTRSAGLIRRADRARPAREAVRARRAARREARRAARREARRGAAPVESHTSRFRRHRFARAA
ncbi:hypothetical protein [Streptomyces sp. WG5]|uniref:hypothetical protein n=1 Tax=Streptomyces sp. WG5 TaxID=3417648 RepID=UPI003CED12D2